MSNDFEKDVVHITIYGAFSKIEGDAPWKEVYAACSYKVNGAEFSKAYKRGLWNGITYLINKKTGSFPSGLVNIVKEVCKEGGKEVYVHDRRIDPGSMSVYGKGSFELNGVNMSGKYAYQLKACKIAVEKERGILHLCTAFGKTFLSAALINYYQLPTLYIVPSKELLHQTRKVFLDHIPNVTEKEIGVIGDGEWQIGSLVTVAIIDSIESKFNTQECRDLLENTDLLIGDEVHFSASDSWYDTLSACNAYYKFGLSGTPLNRTDGANLKVIALFGEVIHTVRSKELVDAGVLPRAKIIFDKIAKPSLAGKKITYNTAYSEGVVKNQYLTEKVLQWTKICVDQGLSVLILVEHIKHGKIIDEALWGVDGAFIPHTFISGQSDDQKNRKEGFEAFDKREIPVLVASNILGTGVSSKAIDVLIPVGYRKSTIRTIQGLGRTLRGEKAIVIEIANYCNKYLLEHSLTRLRDYKAEDCFDIVQSGPDADLIRRLWNGESK